MDDPQRERSEMTALAYETLRVDDLEGGVRLLTLNRPDKANAINTQMAADLLDFFSRLIIEQAGPRCVVVTGAGQKAFCAGGDLQQRNAMDDDAWRAQHLLIERAILAMADCPLPVLAAVNGAAFGGGLELVLNMDFAYAAKTARFALTETSLGIMPGAGGTQNLPRAVGMRRAKEIIFSATPFDAQEAFSWGIINRLFPADQVLGETLAMARRIAQNAPLSIRQAKKSIQLGMEMDRRTGLYFEVEAYNHLVSTQDRREGVAAFNEKRPPRFQGK